jgi:hypothetical protein
MLSLRIDAFSVLLDVAVVVLLSIGLAGVALYLRKHFHHKKKKTSKEGSLEIVREQIETERTTTLSPDCVHDVKEVLKNPQEYLEVNIIRKTRIVDTFYIEGSKKILTYKKLKYKIDEKFIYLLPTKHGFLMPTTFYYEDVTTPVRFGNTNTGITGKALSLLYMPKLYEPLFASDEDKYNLFIVILSVVILICFGIACYFVFFGGIHA